MAARLGAVRHVPEASVTLITPERHPLWVFGAEASTAMRALLTDRGITLRTETRAIHVTDDLGEAKDLAAGRPEKVKELWAKLRAWRKQVNAQMPQPNPGYDPNFNHPFPNTLDPLPMVTTNPYYRQQATDDWFARVLRTERQYDTFASTTSRATGAARASRRQGRSSSSWTRQGLSQAST